MCFLVFKAKILHLIYCFPRLTACSLFYFSMLSLLCLDIGRQPEDSYNGDISRTSTQSSQGRQLCQAFNAFAPTLNTVVRLSSNTICFKVYCYSESLWIRLCFIVAPFHYFFLIFSFIICVVFNCFLFWSTFFLKYLAYGCMIVN